MMIIEGLPLIVSAYDLVSQMGREIGPAHHRKIIDALKGGSKAECKALLEENIRVIRKLENPDKDSFAGAIFSPNRG
jgi:DNA-binding GntR family transcriptional regulator